MAFNSLYVENSVDGRKSLSNHHVAGKACGLDPS